MRYKLGSVTVEAIDTYVRVTVENIGGIGAPPKVACTRRQCPKAIDIAVLLAELRGVEFGHLDRAQLQACAGLQTTLARTRPRATWCYDLQLRM